MDELSREFITTASKREVAGCNNIEELKKVTVSLIDLVQKQKAMIESLMRQQLGMAGDDPSF